MFTFRYQIMIMLLENQNASVSPKFSSLFHYTRLYAGVLRRRNLVLIALSSRGHSLPFQSTSSILWMVLTSCLRMRRLKMLNGGMETSRWKSMRRHWSGQKRSSIMIILSVCAIVRCDLDLFTYLTWIGFV